MMTQKSLPSPAETSARHRLGNDEFETVNKLGVPTKIFTQEMKAYGFSDYFGIGDIIAHVQGGYLHDGVIAAMGGSWLLVAPERVGVNAVREGALFNYNMFAYLDGDFVYKAVEHIHQGGKPGELKAAGIQPDMKKRGAVRSVYDGRYMVARYFSPKEHYRPTSLEELTRFNNVELYDLQSDPLEMNNLAMAGKQHDELVVAMNDKLNRLIDTEVGEDRGQMLPGGADAGWEVTRVTMAP